MDTKTFGSTGTYTDLNAWVSYVTGALVSAGNLTDDVKAQLSGNLVTSSQQIVSGWAPGGSGYTTTIECASGQSFRDNANVRTTALYYSESSYGAYIRSSYSAAAGAVQIRVNKSRIYGLQVKATGGYTRAIQYDSVTHDDLILEGNIIWATFCDNGAVELKSNVDGSAIYVRNNLFKSDRTAAGSMAFRCDGCTSSTNKLKMHDNTFWQNSGAGTTVGMGSSTYCETIGNAFLGGSNCSLSCRDAQCSGSNNATEKAAWDNTGYGAGTITGLTSSQFSITVANEFVDADSAPTDFRLKAGGTQCQGTNITISGITTDITGTSRKATPDIGAWETSSGRVRIANDMTGGMRERAA